MVLGFYKMPVGDWWCWYDWHLWYIHGYHYYQLKTQQMNCRPIWPDRRVIDGGWVTIWYSSSHNRQSAGVEPKSVVWCGNVKEMPKRTIWMQQFLWWWWWWWRSRCCKLLEWSCPTNHLTSRLFLAIDSRRCINWSGRKSKRILQKKSANLTQVLSFLSDSGIPGVRSMGPGVTNSLNSLTDVLLT